MHPESSLWGMLASWGKFRVPTMNISTNYVILSRSSVTCFFQ